MKRGSGTPPASARVWRWPALLSALTLFGLLSALLGQHGVWLGLAWTALAIPLVTIGQVLVRVMIRRRRSGGKSAPAERNPPGP